MTASDNEIALYRKQLLNDYEHRWGPNTLLGPRDNKKALLIVDALRMSDHRPKKVYLCHTSDSAGLIYNLRKTFNCEIVVLTDHPLFERIVDYLNKTLGGVTYNKVNCIFDEPAHYIENDADLVIFPEMEYYVPLRLKEATRKKVCCSYQLDFMNPAASQNIAMSDVEVEDLFSLKINLGMYKSKTNQGGFSYVGIGYLS